MSNVIFVNNFPEKKQEKIRVAKVKTIQPVIDTITDSDFSLSLTVKDGKWRIVYHGVEDKIKILGMLQLLQQQAGVL